MLCLRRADLRERDRLRGGELRAPNFWRQDVKRQVDAEEALAVRVRPSELDVVGALEAAEARVQGGSARRSFDRHEGEDTRTACVGQDEFRAVPEERSPGEWSCTTQSPGLWAQRERGCRVAFALRGGTSHDVLVSARSAGAAAHEKHAITEKNMCRLYQQTTVSSISSSSLHKSATPTALGGACGRTAPGSTGQVTVWHRGTCVR